jgi:hypothetical protein
MQATKKTQVKGGKAAAKVEVPEVPAAPVAVAPVAVAAAAAVQPEVKKGGRKAKVDKVEASAAKDEVKQVADDAVDATAAAVDGDGEESGDGRLRYFKLMYGGEVKGRFCGRKPKQAANKAFSSIIKEKLSGGGNGVVSNVEFSIRECTRGSKQKDYYYNGSREELKNHVAVQIQSGGSTKTITYKFQNKLQKSKAPAAAKQTAGAKAEGEAKEVKAEVAEAAPAVAAGGKAKGGAKGKAAAATSPAKKEKVSTKGKKATA